MSIKRFNFIQEDLSQLFSKVDPKNLADLKGKTVFITGCAGFTGLWLCELIHYLNTNFKSNTSVFGVDNNLDKIKSESPHLLNSKNFSFAKMDVRYLAEVPKETNFAIHCAGIPDPKVHASHPTGVLSTSALGTESILKSLDRLSNFQMFVNLSSGVIYGNLGSRNQPIKESEALQLSSTAPYVSGKIYSEALTNAYRQEYRIPAINVRPFSFIGPYQALTSPWAVNNFINDALTGSVIKVLGTGQTVRSFLYGSDVAYWILRMAVSGQSGETYNLGSSDPIDLKAAASIVNNCFPEQKEITYCVGNTSIHKTNYLVPDNSNTESKLKLAATKNSTQAIQRAVEWYRL